MTQTIPKIFPQTISNTSKLQELEKPKKPTSFGDMLPLILKDNLFDRGITELRRWAGILNFRQAMDDTVYWYTRNAIRNFCKVAINYKFYQSSNFPEYGPALLVSNHQCVLDPFLVGSAIDREIRWMSKIQNFEMPVFKSILSFFGTFAVDREASPTAVLDKAVELLQSGECVGMFPAGTRSPDVNMNPKFKTGAVRIALRAKVPYVPACIIGSHYILPKNTVKPKLHDVEIRVGEPVFLDKYWNTSYSQSDISRLRDEMYEKVHDLMVGEIDPIKKIVITPDNPEYKRRQRVRELNLSIS